MKEALGCQWTHGEKTGGVRLLLPHVLLAGEREGLLEGPQRETLCWAELGTCAQTPRPLATGPAGQHWPQSQPGREG